ncbi:cysteine desulfurase family protein [Acetobacter conturbans]|uniref:Cysteine desulfurase n=1 Tax=Acetobacter conturbans TaxID=1737472 RepID=A0ABX0K4D9_9PROT|nr:cysteine desulfurase family protein [Acetobacter conturbans]NHN89075.1 aminotransferase class V-fold PLP-dependent enzyme [Acetobacter conturbans]
MQEIYLDNAASTPCDARVMAVMAPLFAEEYANPHSGTHAPGQRAAEAVQTARAEIAALIGADPREIIFTSGATEANNLAIKGAARFRARQGDGRKRIITLATEHKCVLESVRDLALEGFEPIILGLDRNGHVDPDRLREALSVPTALVSIMAVNNETGILQDLSVLSGLVKEAGALLHSDLAQAAGKTGIDVKTLNLDLASLSAHKMYGPKGVGALFVRRRPRVRLEPLFSGGGQERGLRSGTLPSTLVAGFGEAARIARKEWSADNDRLAGLAAELFHGLGTRQVAFSINGEDARRLPGIISLRLHDAPAMKVIEALPHLALSIGSACSSADLTPSYVLTAMGMEPSEAAESLRLSPGRFTTPADIARTADLLAGAVQKVRASTFAQKTD